MSGLLPPVFQALKASSAVKNIVGTNPPRIYRHAAAPQGIEGPFVTWFAFGAPENTLSETPAVDKLTVQVDAWHSTDKGVEELALAVREALETHAYCTGLVVDLRETETKLYRMGLQFDWFHDRGN